MTHDNDSDMSVDTADNNNKHDKPRPQLRMDIRRAIFIATGPLAIIAATTVALAVLATVVVLAAG
jgi:hypothetical protein